MFSLTVTPILQPALASEKPTAKLVYPFSAEYYLSRSTVSRNSAGLRIGMP